MSAKDFFRIQSKRAAHYSGHPIAFILAAAIILAWAVTGPIFGFGNTWQLVINTGTTIITFLMVFLIQGSQNRDTTAIQLKLDELIRVTQGAHNVLLDLEELNEDDLEKFKNKYEKIATNARTKIQDGEKDLEVAEVLIDELCMDKNKNDNTPAQKNTKVRNV